MSKTYRDNESDRPRYLRARERRQARRFLPRAMSAAIAVLFLHHGNGGAK